MEPKYKPGDILLLRSEDECEALYRNPSLKRPLSLTLEKMVGKYEDGEREKIFNHIVEKIMKSRRNGTFPYGDSKSHVVRVTGIKKPSEMSGYEEIDGFYYTGTTVCIDFFPKNRECTEEEERIFFGEDEVKQKITADDPEMIYNCKLQVNFAEEIKRKNDDVVSSAYLNDRGAWVINGAMGQKQYYGYTRKEAVNRYKDECKSRVFFNEPPAPVKDSTPPFSPTENKKTSGVIEYVDV